MSKILVVDDEASVLAGFEELLATRGHQVVTAQDAPAAVECAKRERPDLIVMDVWLPGTDGLEAFRAIRALHPRIPAIIMTGSSTTELAIKASKLGAFDYRLKPFEPEEMLGLIERALESAGTPSSEEAGESRPPARAEAMVGQSPAMQEVYKAIGRVAPTDVPVLIRGEAGTGKELVARAIHEHSRRSQRPMLVADCRTMPVSVLECELFGCEKGAPVGAGARRVGKLEKAHGGTLLLNEVGDAPLAIQSKLLRVVRGEGFERIGGEDTLSADVRVLAATSRSLDGLVAAGQFREDLYQELNVVSINIPPLRERPGDIPKLVKNFVTRFVLELGVPEPTISEDGWALMRAHSWPGNVRELEHCLRRALILSRGGAIQAEDIGRALQTELEESAPATAAAGIADLVKELVASFFSAHGGAQTHERLLDEVERELLMEALRRARGSQTRAAAILGIPRPTLHAKIQKYGIHLQPAIGQREDREESSSSGGRPT